MLAGTGSLGEKLKGCGGAAASLSPAQWDLVNTIRCSGETLLTLISDILDFSRIEARGAATAPCHPLRAHFTKLWAWLNVQPSRHCYFQPRKAGSRTRPCTAYVQQTHDICPVRPGQQDGARVPALPPDRRHRGGHGDRRHAGRAEAPPRARSRPASALRVLGSLKGRWSH